MTVLAIATDEPVARTAADERFDTAVQRIRDIARRLRLASPTHAEELDALANELVLVRRDLRRTAPPPPPTRTTVSPANRGRHAVKQRDGQRHCNRCEEWKPLADFEVKDPIKGYLRSWSGTAARPTTPSATPAWAPR